MLSHRAEHLCLLCVQSWLLLRRSWLISQKYWSSCRCQHHFCRRHLQMSVTFLCSFLSPLSAFVCVFFVQVCLPFTCDDLFRMHLDSQELWLNNLEQLLLLLLHPFNSFFYKTTWISRYKKGKTSLALNEARGDGVLECSGISWTIMQTICTSLQTDNHSNTSSLNFYRPDALPDAQLTVSKHWRQRS